MLFLMSFLTRQFMNTLPIQLAAGEGPDIARVTDLGGLNKYYADITPSCC